MRAWARHAGLLSVTGLALAGSFTLVGGMAGASSAAPYTDSNAVGSIGLCNQAGQQITSGSVTARPFAWRAISTTPAQSPYNNAGRTAILVAYQPIQGLPPGDWSGTQLTASSRYTNAANPMVAATAGDLSLGDVIAQYPPRWDGFLQLRIYLGTAQQSSYTQHYPALDIQVTSDTWNAVGGSQVNCASGTAVSIESILLPTTTTTTAAASTSPTTSPPNGAAASGSNGASSGGTKSSTAQAGSKSTPSNTALASSAPGTDDTAGTSHVPLILGLAIVVLAVLAALTLLVLRRRRLSSTSALSDSSPRSSTSTPTKGDTQ